MTSSNANSRLWLALRLYKLPLEALDIQQSELQTIGVTDMQCIIYANEPAIAAGVHFGMDATTARLLSQCEIYARKPEQEKQVLDDLSEKLYQFTPYLEIYQCQYLPHSGLLLELSSCLQLFSGLQSLTARIFNFLQSTPYSFKYGLAHTAKAAWLLSFQDHPILGSETQAIFYERLKKLPIQLLHDFPTVVDALEKTGFSVLEDIIRQINVQNISSIKTRFGSDFAEAISDIFSFGKNLQQQSLFIKPLPTYNPLEFYSENIQFDYPITQNDQLYYPIEILLQKLSDYLRKRQLETQHIEWLLSDIYHNKFTLPVQSDSPESHWQLFYDLTLIKLDNRELPFEVDSLTLSCHNTHALQNRNQLLSFDSSQKSRNTMLSLAITLAKLKARLGEASVYKLSYQDAFLPEASNLKIEPHETPKQNLPHIHQKALRPAWLLASPALIENRKHGLYWKGKLHLLAGPERIKAEWWKKPVARDYFIAQRHDHVRLWIFFDLHNKTWHVHGIFA